jgi:hypothetical protein
VRGLRAGFVRCSRRALALTAITAIALIAGFALAPAPALAAPPGDPTINVRAGGIRAGNTATVNSLPAGATFTATAISGAAPLPSGSCTNTTATITTTTQPYCQMAFVAGTSRNYGVTETAPPTTTVTTPSGEGLGWYLNPVLDTGTSSLVQPRPYQFRTGSLGGAVTNTATVPGLATSTTNNDTNPGTSAVPSTNNYPAQTFSNLLATSLDDPAPINRCGLKIALVLDQSGSMVGSRQSLLQAAANQTVSALTGTPSSLSIFTFGVGTGPSIGPLETTSANAGAANSTVATTLHGFINTLATPSGGTNWDQGLAQAAGMGFDLVVFVTDGAPTAFRGSTGSTGSATFADVEQGIFSANLIKSQGTRIVGVGIAMGTAGGLNNLRAVSGTGPGPGTTGENTD